jgi:hypothetical protein
MLQFLRLCESKAGAAVYRTEEFGVPLKSAISIPKELACYAIVKSIYHLHTLQGRQICVKNSTNRRGAPAGMIFDYEGVVKKTIEVLKRAPFMTAQTQYYANVIA